MKIKLSILIALSLVAVSLAAVSAAGDGVAIYDFSQAKVGNFPYMWRTWPFQRAKAEKVYVVKEEGGSKYIHAYDDQDISQETFYNFDWPVDRRPILSWSWRALRLPEGAAESNDGTNDSACGLYVVVGRYQGHAIKYVWSTTLAPGTVVTRRDGNLKIKVLDSGASKLNNWVSHSVDVAKDYEELFGRKLEKNPSGVGILTDGNAVHKPAGCDYKDFQTSGAK